MKQLIIVVLITCGIAIAQVCTRPATLEPSDVPFVFDANVGRAISWMEIQPGGKYGSEIRVCDPNGDPVVIEPISMPVGMTWDANSNWWHWRPKHSQIGVHYLVMRATDQPPSPAVPDFDEAVYLLHVKRTGNKGPFLLPFGN